jgi:hypothetical protein
MATFQIQAITVNELAAYINRQHSKNCGRAVTGTTSVPSPLMFDIVVDSSVVKVFSAHILWVTNIRSQTHFNLGIIARLITCSYTLYWYRCVLYNHNHCVQCGENVVSSVACKEQYQCMLARYCQLFLPCMGKSISWCCAVDFLSKKGKRFQFIATSPLQLLCWWWMSVAF